MTASLPDSDLTAKVEPATSQNSLTSSPLETKVRKPRTNGGGDTRGRPDDDARVSAPDANIPKPVEASQEMAVVRPSQGTDELVARQGLHALAYCNLPDEDLVAGARG